MMIFAVVLHLFLLTTLAVMGWKKVQLLRRFYWPALVAKFIAGILVGLLYKYYYTVGDTFVFFQDASLLAKLARTDFGTYLSFLWNGDESFAVWSDLIFKQQRSLFFAKLISFFSLITLDNYWLTALYFSFFSFVGAWFLVTTIGKLFPGSAFASIIAFLFFPSIVFWGSGIVKESVAFACLCFLSAIFIRLWKKNKVSVVHWLLAAWVLWVLWNLKYYYAAVFMPVVVTAYLIHTIVAPRLKLRQLRLEIVTWAVIFVVPLFLVTLIHPNFYPDRLLDVIVANYEAFFAISDPDDMIHFHELKATPLSMAMNSPLALLSGLFRPFIWEAGNVLQMLIAMENTALVVLFVASLRALKALRTSPHRILILALMIYTIILCVFITLSTPNFGTLARYRVGYLPFFLFLIMMDNPLARKVEKLLQRFTGDLVRKQG